MSALFERLVHFYWGRGLAYLAPAVAFYLLLLLPTLLLGLAALAGIFFPDEINSQEIAEVVADRFAADLQAPIVRFSESVFSGRTLLLSVPIMVWTLSAILSLLERGMSPMPLGGWRLVFGRLRLLILAAGLLALLLFLLLLPFPRASLLPALPLVLAALYRYLPPQAYRPRWREAFLGSLPASLILLLAPQLFAFYLSFSSFSPASFLPLLALFLLSSYLLAFALLVGAGIASQKTAGKKNISGVPDKE